MFTFNFNHYVQESQAGLQNPKSGGRDLPTKAPSCDSVSIKSKSQRIQDNFLDCSFDGLCDSNHAQILWEASLKYLSQCLNEKNQFNMEKGFNDQKIFNIVIHKLSMKGKSNKQIILLNNLLKSEEKQKLLKFIQEQIEISNFIKQLSNYFYVSSSLNELIYCVYKIQQTKNQDKKTKQIKQNNFIIPHFDCLHENQQNQLIRFSSYEPFFDQKFSSQLIIEADEITDKIAQEIYFDKNIKYLNLKNIVKQHQEIVQNFVYFKEFLKEISRTIYLILQGFFSRPEVESDQQKIYEDFNFNLQQINDLEDFEDNQNNNFSIILQNNSNQQQQEIRKEPYKKIKSQ